VHKKIPLMVNILNLMVFTNLQYAKSIIPSNGKSSVFTFKNPLLPSPWYTIKHYFIAVGNDDFKPIEVSALSKSLWKSSR
jgi:hypothetical protein